MSDYDEFLIEVGITEHHARMLSENPLDQIMLEHDYGVSVRDSDIEGNGLFADKSIVSGDAIIPSSIGGKRTIAGRYINHSGGPNSEMFAVDGNIGLFAITDIHPGKELTVDYRNASVATTAAHYQTLEVDAA